MKEVRNLNISFSLSGSKSQTNRITLPTSWVRKMNITEDNRSVEVTFNDETQTITIKKK